MTGTIKRYTSNLNLRIPIFDSPGWGREMERNFDVLDAAIYSVSALANVQGIWSNGELYHVADRIVDDTDNTVWICDVEHASASTDTFAVDRAAHPTYWHQLSGVVQTRGAWTTATEYVLNDFVVNGNEVAVCVVSSYTSSATYAQDIVDGNLVVIIDLDPQLSAAASSAAAALVSENNAAASESAVAADQLTVAADKATVAADKATVAADKGIVAADKAIVAADKGIVAADKATVAADKATTQGYMTDAQAAETAAVVAQVAAEAALAATLTAYDNFDDRYLGTKAADPVLDNDGNALVAGQLYYNSVTLVMMLYNGSSWVAAYVSGAGYLASANNLSDLINAATARINLGLQIGVNVQAYSADLAAMAALTSAADKMYYATGAGTWAAITLTSAARALFDDTTAAQLRATMGLSLGSQAQAWDATLDSLALLGTAADKLAYTTGVNTWAETAFTAFARTILDDVDAAAVRSTLGLGTMSTQASTAYVATGADTSGFAVGVSATADNDGSKASGTYTPDYAGGNLKRITNDGAFTLAAPSAAGDYSIVIQITNGASAGAITLSGFSKSVGDSFTTTNGHDFFVYIMKINGFISSYTQALQ